MNRYYDPAIRTETLEESETTIISTDPRVEPFFHELKEGYEVKYTEDNLPLIVKIPELTEQENNEMVWNHFRSVRNSKLVQTDWWASADLTMTDEQTAYRKELRDLPSTASPSFDENGQLTGVTWPTEPTE